MFVDQSCSSPDPPLIHAKVERATSRADDPMRVATILEAILRLYGVDTRIRGGEALQSSLTRFSRASFRGPLSSQWISRQEAVGRLDLPPLIEPSFDCYPELR